MDITRMQAIDILEKEKAYMLQHGGDSQAAALEMAINSLKIDETYDLLYEEVKPDGKIILKFSEGAIKYSGKDYVVYKKDWFKKNWAAEVEIMTGIKAEQTEVIKCKDCKHFEHDAYNVPGARLILGHEMCHRWGNGCTTEENGFCFLAEAKQEE